MKTCLNLNLRYRLAALACSRQNEPVSLHGARHGVSKRAHRSILPAQQSFACKIMCISTVIMADRQLNGAGMEHELDEQQRDVLAAFSSLPGVDHEQQSAQMTGTTQLESIRENVEDIASHAAALEQRLQEVSTIVDPVDESALELLATTLHEAALAMGAPNMPSNVIIPTKISDLQFYRLKLLGATFNLQAEKCRPEGDDDLT
ncbi:hypothetical protein CBOM_05679 [Ceraceosorus bombacis]|uniref:Uncharacterized protein n=1 Tax=Ceraceosorus bombacis TaxID=401625 RepID=A0A0P1BRG2_9BASI|nr:hypothetical protein CBOM_05679 [Ceraceosorus bombacis]